MKQNCWEYKRCGFEEGGANVAGLGVCAAYNELRLNGVHGGVNGGRACWVVAGTHCGGNLQESYSNKIADCRLCDFFSKVNNEEGQEALKTVTMLNMLG